MKTAIVLSITAIILSGCTRNSKELTSVAQGMNKPEVIQAIGEPTRKNDLKVAELWVYPEYNKTVIFRADTVYDIVNSSTASVDSIKSTFKKLGTNIKQGAKKIGKELDTVGKKLEGKLDNDTTDNKP